MNILEAVKGINGGYEINRLVGFFGGLVFIVSTVTFVGYEVIWLNKDFDITAFCLTFPAGIAGIVGGTAGAVALKDRAVASAKVTEKTGAIPAEPPKGPQVPAGTDVSHPSATGGGHAGSSGGEGS
jgi:hypothetical protein